VHAGPHARLGFGLELCALRFMGFVPDDLTSAPPEAVTFVARQLAMEPGVLARHTGSAHTRMHHRQTIQAYLGYRRTRRADMERLAAWLLERALEHETPALLYALACEQLQRERLVRPGVTQLERLVAETCQSAQAETFRRLGPIQGGEDEAGKILAQGFDLAWGRREPQFCRDRGRHTIKADLW
jgi:hypothetical protein